MKFIPIAISAPLFAVFTAVLTVLIALDSCAHLSVSRGTILVTICSTASPMPVRYSPAIYATPEHPAYDAACDAALPSTPTIAWSERSGAVLTSAVAVAAVLGAAVLVRRPSCPILVATPATGPVPDTAAVPALAMLGAVPAREAMALALPVTPAIDRCGRDHSCTSTAPECGSSGYHRPSRSRTAAWLRQDEFRNSL